MSEIEAQFKGMNEAYESDLSRYMKMNGVCWSDKLGLGGTLTNLEVGMTWLTTFGSTGLARGCLACQSQTFKALYKYLRKQGKAYWKIDRIVVGNGFEHHAVAAYRIDCCFTNALIFDPWINQSPAYFPFEVWKSKMWKLKVLGGVRIEK